MHAGDAAAADYGEALEMANLISINGFISSDIESKTLDTGTFVSNFRMGSTESKLDPVTGQWVDGHTNWFHVQTYRALAVNTAMSIHKGDRVIVTGKLRITTYLRKDGTQGTNVNIEADSIGHDLKFGVVTFHKVANGRAKEGNGSVNAGTEAGAAAGSNEGSGHDGPEPSWPPDDPDGEGSGLSDHPGAGNNAGTMAGATDGNSGDPASAQSEDGLGLEDGEVVDEDTGEVVTAAAPF